MKRGLGLYYLGATILDTMVLSRVQKYTDKMRMLLGADINVEKERHITIIPPFYAKYKAASGLRLGCDMATLLPSHPLTTTLFSMKGMSVMPFNGLDVVCFPVKIHPQLGERRNFVDYVKAVHQKMTSLGIEFKEPLLPNYTPHITGFIGKGIAEDPLLKKMIRESGREDTLFFHSDYPTLYAKYPRFGWQVLTRDPAVTE